MKGDNSFEAKILKPHMNQKYTHEDEARAVEISMDKIMKGMYTYLNFGVIKNNEWNLLIEKNYILEFNPNIEGANIIKFQEENTGLEKFRIEAISYECSIDSRRKNFTVRLYVYDEPLFTAISKTYHLMDAITERKEIKLLSKTVANIRRKETDSHLLANKHISNLVKQYLMENIDDLESAINRLKKIIEQEKNN